MQKFASLCAIAVGASALELEAEKGTFQMYINEM
jgi:hypothetical protein